MANVKRKRPCKYGEQCYRKNPKHLEEFSHDVMNTNEEDEDDHKSEEDNNQAKKRARTDDYFVGKEEQSNSTTSSQDSEKNTYTEENDAVNPSKTKNIHEDDVPSQSTSSYQVSDETNEEEMDDPRQDIKSKFLMDMPEDFYEFWKFAKSLNSSDPSAAFASSLALHLVGPYDVLAGKTKTSRRPQKKRNYLRHWRYYYDPPELLTIIKGDKKTQFHVGYYRDDPREMPSFLVSNSAAENGVLKKHGENIFAAMNSIITERLKKSKENLILNNLQNKLTSWAEENGFSLELKTMKMKERDKLAVCKCFHGVGVVVPVDGNGIGYRPVPETQADLKTMLRKIKMSKTEEERNVNFDPLMELITFIQFANDECDYGEGLELGLNLFSFGGETFHKAILNLLPLAYQLLGRHEYSQIIEAHLEKRRDCSELSELED